MNREHLLLKQLPSVDKVLRRFSNYTIHRQILIKIIQKKITTLRRAILSDKISPGTNPEALVYDQVCEEISLIQAGRFQRVINGTGIILHTGLGRAPFSGQFWQENEDNICGYQNLEFDLTMGKRGERLDHCEQLLHYLSGAERALVVNNNAAALLLLLNTLAMKKEVIVSRGELIEIGGSFRLPDVIAKSGAKIREIGTTNRTHLRDYKEAITTDTAVILIAHSSNYKIQGFTKSPSYEDILKVGEHRKIPVILDQGSGDFQPEDSNNIENLITSGFDALCFSGDKLLGGPQSGIILGREELIRQCHENPLYRALRCDKFTVMALEWTLRKSILQEDKAIGKTYLASRSQRDLQQIAEKIIATIDTEITSFFGIEARETTVEMGSGSLPTEKFDSMGLFFSNINAESLAKAFRKSRVPVIGYIHKNYFIIDLKAIHEHEIDTLEQQILQVFDSLKDQG
ncbi:MAG: L-seryl-tRNA(Sec) selenium transferase [Fidelibacterota bacterium]